MSMKVLIRGKNNSLNVLSPTCFTKENYGANTNGNATLSVNTPIGVLGGSVAAVSAGYDYTSFPCDLTAQPIGLFMNDAAGSAYDNAPAVASNKLTVMSGPAEVEVDVYETKSVAGTDITYAVGQKLYSSKDGLLTNEASTSTVVIGIVTKRPTTGSPIMGLELV